MVQIQARPVRKGYTCDMAHSMWLKRDKSVHCSFARWGQTMCRLWGAVQSVNTRVRLQVLSHIVDRLKDQHGAGFVHRDIKPGNIMWLPRTKRWTLIDFGCAARTGSHARTGFSLFYAAPEALRAYMAGEGGVVAAEALDAWSLGVLAIELLTGKPVFNHMQPKEEVR